MKGVSARDELRFKVSLRASARRGIRVSVIGAALALAFACASKSATSAPDVVVGAAGQVNAGSGGGCVPDRNDGTLVCGAFTLGKGAACDSCVEAHCSPAGSECCHRAAACGNPSYEYRVLISQCIADECGEPCGVACENWPTPGGT